jgi:hypothetical protein
MLERRWTGKNGWPTRFLLMRRRRMRRCVRGGGVVIGSWVRARVNIWRRDEDGAMSAVGLRRHVVVGRMGMIEVRVGFVVGRGKGGVWSSRGDTSHGSRGEADKTQDASVDDPTIVGMLDAERETYPAMGPLFFDPPDQVQSKPNSLHL